MAEYKFDETGGAVAHDSAGSVDGNLGGGASFVGGGVRGGAISLDKATNGYVEMGDHFYFASSFSVEAWVKMPAGSTDLDSTTSAVVMVGMVHSAMSNLAMPTDHDRAVGLWPQAQNPAGPPRVR